MTYAIVEALPPQGATVFFIESSTGVIRTVTSLTTARDDPYRVSSSCEEE